MNIALILAGGIGSRMKSSTPKQFLTVQDKPLIIHTLEVFQKCDDISSIMVVSVDEGIQHIKELCCAFKINKVRWIVAGGSTRHKSICNGLEELRRVANDDDKIIIHNANMPLVTSQNICGLISLCQNFDVVTTVSPCSEFFYRINKSNNILEIGPDRSDIVHAKTPEAFCLKAGLELYWNEDFQEIKYESYTSGMLAIVQGKKVGYVQCKSSNIKVTTPDDLALIEKML